MKKKDVEQYLINLMVDIKENNIDLKTINIKWEKYMDYQLKLWNFNKYAIKELIMWGRGGHNWELLHWNEEKNYKEYLDEFADEIHYCCDRMSMDRLMRCHWLLNAALNTYMIQNNKPTTK